MEVRFWNKVNRKADHECWEWIAFKHPLGYGHFGLNGKVEKAHRVAYKLHHKTTIPEGLVVRHKCDNPPCCNPSHLELGTLSDNSRDMKQRGRSLFGERSNTAKLTDQQIQEIRDRMKTYTRGLQSQLAIEYGVSQSAISRVINGKNWSHL